MRLQKDEVIEPSEFGNRFLHGDFEIIYKQCSNDFRELISFEDFRKLAKSSNRGVVSYQVAEEISMGDFKHYLWLDNSGKKAVFVSFDENYIIHSIYLKPYTIYPRRDETFTQNRFIMPITDEWFVFWGGKNEFLNYHYVYESQRYAYDLVVMKEKKTYRESEILNENYFAFNKELVAPATGQVVKVVGGVKDNTPGDMNESQPAGNYVVMRHSVDEYSLVAHFKQNSIQVREGETVQQGQMIGLCGNSGNSSEPHIHFQVMDSPDLFNCTSICIRFTDGCQPIQGDTVTQGPLENDIDKPSLDNFEKAEIAFSLSDVLGFIPRIIGQFFK
ncbi:MULTISPECIES: M23 family metallopeptidase [unclassified Planococcus (in: firmicutes)]|uniref:M23 family metallopeptidase n=1 Tax=unclassified Planococcus (in: firmicutes) TaxID=2662419 RepID=UPI000C326B16|nr:MULTISPECIES: M23 family metallopeptidase [unclassified Planococcus (in: firmicutes)]AUD15072.1 M23 family peptidase [Planococcus sp. MB-3u-03]PKG46988.1 M23 family peptidase [Planococcus sp. Urea-trap-24]PKG87883.1 M23 family peptidase [Planococcus sp. Urea-3u-39]PKH39110.1 M23 family peptidase [Planococcus sp. MB-3u-09]